MDDIQMIRFCQNEVRMMEWHQNDENMLEWGWNDIRKNTYMNKTIKDG